MRTTATTSTTTPTPIYRVRILQDEDFEPETPEGTPLPGTREAYEANQIMRLIDPADDPVTGARRPVSWEEYLEREGNPDRYVGVGVVLDRQCPCCQQWTKHVQSVWGIELMDDSPELQALGQTVAAADFDTLPAYLRDVARDLLAEEGGAR